MPPAVTAVPEVALEQKGRFRRVSSIVRFQASSFNSSTNHKDLGSGSHAEFTPRWSAVNPLDLTRVPKEQSRFFGSIQKVRNVLLAVIRAHFRKNNYAR
jgi:hypothetical protein